MDFWEFMVNIPFNILSFILSEISNIKSNNYLSNVHNIFSFVTYLLEFISSFHIRKLTLNNEISLSDFSSAVYELKKLTENHSGCLAKFYWLPHTPCQKVTM